MRLVSGLRAGQLDADPEAEQLGLPSVTLEIGRDVDKLQTSYAAYDL
jgi:hypothetical protein